MDYSDAPIRDIGALTDKRNAEDKIPDTLSSPGFFAS
jgi:hypothetical protein